MARRTRGRKAWLLGGPDVLINLYKIFEEQFGSVYQYLNFFYFEI